MRVEVADVTSIVRRHLAAARGARPTTATSWCRATSSRRTPRPPVPRPACGRSRRCGSRAASRGSASTPTHRTIPNEVGWIGTAVHMDKGCYRGQETVARVHTLGRPPRRLALLHLDGSENRLPAVGADLLLGEKSVGFVGLLGPAPRAGPDRARAGEAERRPRRRAPGRRHARRAGGRGRPRGRDCTCARCAEVVSPSSDPIGRFSTVENLRIGSLDAKRGERQVRAAGTARGCPRRRG